MTVRHAKNVECPHKYFDSIIVIDVAKVNCLCCKTYLRNDVTLKEELNKMLISENKRLKSHINKVPIAKKWKSLGKLGRQCTSCKSIMKIRLNKFIGKKFWGCTNYPRCKNTEYIN
jgi:hypothetical protein